LTQSDITTIGCHNIAIKCDFVTDIVMISATERPVDDVEVLRPTNTITTVGSEVTLRCRSRVDNESRWDFYAHDDVTPVSVYNGNTFGDNVGRRISMDFDKCRFKTCHLTIESVQLKDAGHYVCFESSGSTRRAASLVVLRRL